MNNRLNELDSLRGIASFTVLIHHCLISYSIFLSVYYFNKSDNPLVNLLAFSPLHLAWAGHEAVIFFFILSGFVLTIPFIKKRKFSYGNFIIKRFCRIYIPYAVCILLSLLMFKILASSHTEALSSWFNNMWVHPLEMKEVISFIFLFGVHTSELDTTTWSLVHEMRISFVLPFILILLMRNNLAKFLMFGTIIYIALLLLFYYTINILDINAKYSLIKSSRDTVYYLGFFIAGSLIAKYLYFFKMIYKKISFGMKVFLLGLGFFLYLIEWIFPHLGYLKYNSHLFTELSMNFLIDWCIGLGTALLTILSLNSSKVKTVLEKRTLIYLGQISYSLYLIHPIILLIYVHFTRGTFLLDFIIIFVPLFSLICAHFLHKYIEVPSIRIGKLLVSNKSNRLSSLKKLLSINKI